MGWQERDYSSDIRPGGAGGVAQFGNVGIIYPRWGSITLWLILINCGLLLVDGIVTRIAASQAGADLPHGLGYLAYFFSFSIATTFQQFRVWELLTFQFQHAGLWHLLGNLIFLFFFGPMVESFWGSRRFLAFYLLCGVGGVLGYLILASLGLFEVQPATPLVGASAGVFGVMIGALFVAPNARVLLFFLIPIPLKALVFIALFVAVYVVVVGGPNVGGEAAHLGGAAMGLLFMKVRWLLDWADTAGVGEIRGRLEAKRQARAQQRQKAEDAEVDRLLDKVRDQGLHSLTKKEKKILNRATERRRRKVG